MPVSPTSIPRLLEIMAKLRAPEGGCPWDLEQNFATIAPYTIEEAYEVYQAITDGDKQALKDELGDLLFQVVFHAQMAAEEGAFTFEDVVENVCEKMIRRHPHVFGDASIATADAQVENWEKVKERERAEKRAAQQSILADVPLALPALMRAQKLSNRAARVGFDWPDMQGILEKIDEELEELYSAAVDADEDAISEELGDVLFSITNLARALGVDAEAALRGTNQKFIRRFNYIEHTLGARGEALESQPLEVLEALWNEAKLKGIR